ncbi:Ger(x)C family spore germination protein [Cohnella candidum]|nr:Ger(x)C family spore germination protein [Cohnella candidum]
MRKFFLLLNLLLAAVCLNGCWSRVEVNDIAIVTATGLDVAENGKIRLSLMLAIPRLIGSGSAQSGSESKIETSAAWVVSEEGDTIMDTYRSLQEKLPRKIFFAHSRLLVIGQALAVRGIEPYLDFFERYRQSQLKSFLVVSKTTASDVLNFKSKFEKLPSEVLKEEMKQELIPKVRLIDFVNMLTSEGEEPFTPIVEIVPSETGKSGMNNLSVTGLAVFRRSSMVGQLDSKQGRGAMWVRNRVKEGVITIEVPKSAGAGKISAELEDVKVKRRLSVRDDRLFVRLVINIDENIYENTSSIDLNKSRNVNYVQGLMKEDIEERIQEASRKVQQEYKSDIFGFGQSLYRQDPKKWKREFRSRWPDMFPKTVISVEIHVNVLRTGLTNRVIRVEE